MDVAGSIRSARVIETLTRLIAAHGAPASCGPTMARSSSALAGQQRLNTALIDPGKPWQNGDAESLNGKFRDECLSLEWFRIRIEARVVIHAWRQHSATSVLTRACKT